jgi:hypothetical protein
MTWLDGYRMRLVLVGFAVVIVLGGGSAKADFTFGKPTNLGPTVNSSSGDGINCISTDGLEMYLDSDRSGGYGGWDIWVATRGTIDDDWGTPMNLGPKINSSSTDETSCISFDGLELYFCSDNRPGGHGSLDIWVSKRETTKAEWGAPVNLGATVNGSSIDGDPWISTDGLELYIGSNRPGGYGTSDIYVTKRATTNDPWGEPVNLGAVVNSSASEGYNFVSVDGQALFFSPILGEPYLPGGFGNGDMWVTRRANASDPWNTPVNLGPVVNTSSYDGVPRISPDGYNLYFCSERPGGFGGAYGDIWQAPILPVIDFTGDYRVDIEDLLILIEHWGQNEPAYDMGPMPWGDGVIDQADLEVLMSYWGQEVYDPHLMAHWKLDETEGDVAYDSATDNDAVVMGNATWEPDKGTVDGALQLDGIDDHIDTLFKLNPTDGPFSVFAWVKGGAPGQVIISQENGVDWLMADGEQGGLRTDISDPTKSVRGGTTGGLPLISPATITDGNWHRVGFVRDGKERILYVDDIEVARDTVEDLDSATGSLFIGVDSNLEVGTFWSGMIDDVRIYDRAVEP